jgi:3alpha(or 20beta)-hydroxysteroid dehydrogenase
MYEHVYRINQLGPFLGMKAMIPLMKSKGGSIVNVSSTAGLKGYSGMSAYVATKFAVRGMSKVAALELAQYKIRVNSVHPGFIYTSMTEQLGEEWQAASAKATPLGRGAQPIEVARLIGFLASDESSFSTGGEFTCDGGITA